MAREHADRLKDRPEETWAEILRRLRHASGPVRGMFARVQIGPERSDDIPDEPAVRLVIMHPQYRHARGDVDGTGGSLRVHGGAGRGTAHRLNRNMIVFLAADAKRYEELDDAVRQYLAWKDLAGTEERIRELELPPQQAAQARKRLKDADETVALRISASYQWLLVPVQTPGGPLRIDELKADTNKDRLAERASDRLKQRRHAARRAGRGEHPAQPRPVLARGSRDGHITVGKLWEYYCQYPYLPRLTERSVLERGILAVFDSADLGRTRLRGRHRVRRDRPAGTPGSRSRTRTRCRSSPTRRCSSGRTGPAPSETPSAPRRPRPPGPPQKRRPGGRQRRRYRRWRCGRSWRRYRSPTAARSQEPRPARAGRLLPAVSPRPLPRHPRTPASTAPSASTRSATAAISTACTRRSSSTSPPPRAWTWRSPSRSRRSRRTATPTTTTRIVSENARTLKFDQSGFEDR